METCASSLVAQPWDCGVEKRPMPQPISSANVRVETVRVANNMLYVSKSNRLRACFINVSAGSLWKGQSSLSKAGAIEIACVLLSEDAFRCTCVGHTLNLWTSRPRVPTLSNLRRDCSNSRAPQRVQPAWTARRITGSDSNWRCIEERESYVLLTADAFRKRGVLDRHSRTPTYEFELNEPYGS